MQNLLLIGTLAALAANLPFLSEKIFWVRQPQDEQKAFAWRLLEMAVGCVLVGLVARLVEGQQAIVHTQNWQFYAVVLALFVVLAWPGFVWRYFWRRPGL